MPCTPVFHIPRVSVTFGFLSFTVIKHTEKMKLRGGKGFWLLLLDHNLSLRDNSTGTQAEAWSRNCGGTQLLASSSSSCLACSVDIPWITCLGNGGTRSGLGPPTPITKVIYHPYRPIRSRQFLSQMTQAVPSWWSKGSASILGWHWGWVVLGLGVGS